MIMSTDAEPPRNPEPPTDPARRPHQRDSAAPPHAEQPVDPVIEIPLEPVLDLHPFRPAETRSVVASYLEEALARGWTEVRIVHGRGRGVQRRIIRSLLSSHPAVRHFADAPAHRGGWGATIVQL
jgi:dsDNA-specific endonuclease/ATPase MutS2